MRLRNKVSVEGVLRQRDFKGRCGTWKHANASRRGQLQKHRQKVCAEGKIRKHTVQAGLGLLERTRLCSDRAKDSYSANAELRKLGDCLRSFGPLVCRAHRQVISNESAGGRLTSG